MTTTVESSPDTSPPGRGARLVDRMVSALVLRRPEESGYTVTRGLRVPMRDGIDLVADLYSPTTTPALGTVLVRGPYGRGSIYALFSARLYAARGYHVLLQSCRGTFGSGDVFTPMRHEIADGHDTVAWMREQPWFDGRLATLGPSYLGFTQWALLMDPPPELRTAVVTMAPHDFHRAVHGAGAFSLGDFFGWSEMVAHQEVATGGQALLRAVTAARRLRPAFHDLPLVSAGQALLSGRAPWYPDWASRPDADDPFWENMRLDAALDRVQVPVLVIGGWQDLFLDQTLAGYEHLHRRGVDVGLTIGPWTHTDLAGKGSGVIARETLDWLGEHLAGRPGTRRPAPVRIHVGGADGGWRGLPEWPPPPGSQVLHLQPAGALGSAAPAAGALPVMFTYNPDHPTPSVGGRVLAGGSGVRDNRALEARPDVVTFTGPPLPADLEVVGSPVVELAHTSDNPHADLFVRICDVDAKGRSRNVSDGFVRLVDADRADRVVRVDLDAMAHRFAAGHRIRLLVAGGAHPRFARNLGTDEPAADGMRTLPSHRTIAVDGRSRVVLPVAAP
ncbi:CocE/NonD family hydrolase [Pseudonocardia xinjiangensis]|uniref:CocE/NonD family hydrolase n=1 Tax=Pseudonocardia xinjiangensis TaxID=75289 RepID=A0ABX1RGJ2_9PSEU|nr:CocE/NonD family hydrolase [Pseudonocardia xinjiangensis]NMH78353.1 CocE/NonD family hydrolase [Pseudonocardia xinjiangensis]